MVLLGVAATTALEATGTTVLDPVAITLVSTVLSIIGAFAISTMAVFCLGFFRKHQYKNSATTTAIRKPPITPPEMAPWVPISIVNRKSDQNLSSAALTDGRCRLRPFNDGLNGVGRRTQVREDVDTSLGFASSTRSV